MEVTGIGSTCENNWFEIGLKREASGKDEGEENRLKKE